ncbi:MAG: thioredoxin [Clostridia bacterium]|nr:thioredoxin [Clostridia bacterium]
MVQHFNQASFEAAVSGDKPVLVDFWASWCGPCRMIAPVIEQIGAEFEGRAVVGKVNVDEETALARQFGVMSIPMLVVIKGGKVVETAIGARGRDAVAAMLEKHL